ncbi:MAG: tRNA lysidine(34) synthetase TilS [Magnetococcales bacterium]|nr:tRNA lysidine(34) synthetase TilS [Magnetococcales bacterium]
MASGGRGGAASTLVSRFRQQAGPLLPPASRLVVAVSGGADSMALLQLLLASELLPLAAIQVAHFDHGLRPDSAADARFVAAAAAERGLVCTVGCWERAVAAPTGGLAAQARAARYQFLLECAEAWGAERVATGHHRDDQAETFLERLLRGSGVGGLGAMAVSRPLSAGVALVRPLLGLSRGELRAWLEAVGHPWREDASNRKLTARRNRLRHQALPCLQQVADGDLSQRLAATAGRMAQASTALEWMLERLWPQWDPRWEGEGCLSLASEPLPVLPEELLCRCLHRCHQYLHGHGRPPGERAVAGFVQRVRSRRSHWLLVVQGLRVERQQGRIFFHALEGVSARSVGKMAFRREKPPGLDRDAGNH